MTKKIDRTVELVLRLESAARQSTGEEARDFKDAAHRLGAYAAACQGFSADLADIAEAVGLSREECLEPPAVVYAVRKMADRMRSGGERECRKENACLSTACLRRLAGSH